MVFCRLTSNFLTSKRRSRRIYYYFYCSSQEEEVAVRSRSIIAVSKTSCQEINEVFQNNMKL
jgi:hypothetical protein